MNATTHNTHLLAANLNDDSRSYHEAPNRLATSTIDATDRHPVISELESLASDWSALPPDVALAVGVLRQAARDLHTFRSAERGIEHKIYRDAYAWICDEDYSWPYSFLNVCASLRVSADVMRAEVLADAPLSWCVYWKRIIARRAKSLRVSLAGAFRTPQTA